MIQIPLDGEPQRCLYPDGGGRCGKRAVRTLDTGMGVVAACVSHQRTSWWRDCQAEARRALAKARAGWVIEDAKPPLAGE